jgi:hypothetical protein
MDAWDTRRDLRQAERAAGLFKALAKTEDSSAAWAWCARSHFFVGDYQETTKQGARWHEEGWRLARTAAAREDFPIGGSFWTGVCLAAYIDTLSALRAPLYIPEIVTLHKRVYDEDMEYHYGALARFLGQALVRNPGLTKKFLALAMPGIGAQIVIDGLRRAVEEAPPVVLNFQTLGEVCFHVHKDRDTAGEMLRRLEKADLDEDPNVAPDNHLDLPRATQKLTAVVRG